MLDTAITTKRRNWQAALSKADLQNTMLTTDGNPGLTPQAAQGGYRYGTSDE